ncbi:MAG: anti-sigma factor [Phyllobacteriaceae bacterium]|nr:anti-sigma factor [Phyllobacteriaceae bacterium]
MSDDRSPIGEDDLTAAVDGRLSPARAALLRARLAEDPDLAARVAAEVADRQALRDRLRPIADEPIPSRLRIASLRDARRRRFVARGRAAAAALVLFVAGLGTGLVAAGGGGGIAARDVPVHAVVAEDASDAYRTFVVEVAHPVEVDAAHETHLLGWLSKRLGRRIVAPNLGGFGWKLVGGRLLPAGASAAAQLMYEDGDGKRLTLWVQAAPGEETAFRYSRKGEASTFVWIDRGWGFAVTAGLERDRLLPITEAIYRGLDG